MKDFWILDESAVRISAIVAVDRTFYNDDTIYLVHVAGREKPLQVYGYRPGADKLEAFFEKEGTLDDAFNNPISYPSSNNA